MVDFISKLWDKITIVNGIRIPIDYFPTNTFIKGKRSMDKSIFNTTSQKIATKKCNKCGESFPYTIDFFIKNNRTKSGIGTICRTCNKKYYLEYNAKNKEKLKKINIEYVKKNAIKIKQYQAIYREKNSERNKQYASEYRVSNPDVIKTSKKNYYKKNAGKIKKKTAILKKNNCLFNSVSSEKLSIYEKTKESEDGFVLVRCAYCGRWVLPTIREVSDRIRSCEKIGYGECRIYCKSRKGENGCRQACPTFKRRLYPAGFKRGTSREVNPIVRQMCFERDNFECQRCGTSINEIQLHCHHIEGARQNPLLSNDLSNVITYCKKCHEIVHRKPGCGYHELKCNNK